MTLQQCDYNSALSVKQQHGDGHTNPTDGNNHGPGGNSGSTSGGTLGGFNALEQVS